MTRPSDPTAKIALLRAAEEVFAEKGADHAKVEDIARAAHVSKGAFYLHFESKEAVFKQVVESFLGRMSAQFTMPMDTVPETPEALLSFWESRDEESFEFLWQSRAILGILQSCSGDYQYLLEAFRGECRATAMQWIDLLKDRGLVRKEVNAEVTATLMNGAYNELVMQLLSQKVHPDLHSRLTAAREIFIRGIGMPRLIAALDRYLQNPRVTNGIEARGKAAPRHALRDPQRGKNGARRTDKRNGQEVGR